MLNGSHTQKVSSELEREREKNFWVVTGLYKNNNSNNNRMVKKNSSNQKG